MVDATARQALQQAQAELYRAQVALLEVRTVLQDLWDRAQYDIYFRMLTTYRTSLQHIYRAAFDIQAQTEYHYEPHGQRSTGNPVLAVAYVEPDTL